MNAVNRNLVPLGVTIPKADKEIAGGYFIWCTLPEPLSASEITEKALHEEGLTVIDGPRFQVVGDEEAKENRFERDIRLCFAWEKEELLEEGVKRLARVITNELA
jgi:DNA-binding transcriptional MocR family regulator